MGFLFSFIPWPNAEILQELAGGQAGEKKERGWFCQQIQLRKVQIFIYGFSEGQFCFAFSEKKKPFSFYFFSVLFATDTVCAGAGVQSAMSGIHYFLFFIFFLLFRQAFPFVRRCTAICVLHSLGLRSTQFLDAKRAAFQQGPVTHAPDGKGKPFSQDAGDVRRAAG